MPSSPKVRRPRIYLDSNVFLALFNKEEGRLKTVVTLLQEGERAKVEIFTSELTLAECPKSKHHPEAWTSERIADFFENEWLSVIEVDRDVVLLSREIQVASSLKPMDALHIATAQLVGDLDAVFSYDSDHILKKGSALMPSIKVCKPEIFWTTLPLELGDV